jgi:hypothetical protein
MVAPTYLQPSEYRAYGIAGCADSTVAQACQVVDGWCRRPRSGFLWTPDALGNPAYMSRATADLTYNAATAISPGTNVVVPVTGLPVTPAMVGRVVTLDAVNPEACETAIITTVNNPLGTLTLDTVNFSHAAPVALQMGLQIFEERYLPEDRSITRVSQWPVVRVVGGQGRYSYGRRSQQVQGNFSEFNLLAIMQVFGGPPAWVQFDTNLLDINPLTGEMWIPAGILLAYYSDVRLYYVAGWPFANLPDGIKRATANIARNYQFTAGTPGASGLFKKFAAGDTSIERFADLAVDDETVELLTPFRSNLLF